ncbi:Ribonuclease H2 subunit C [Coemansia spiralis]|nr:Ribonuclease H2 subunit C [Coemansia spiralis]
MAAAEEHGGYDNVDLRCSAMDTAPGTLHLLPCAIDYSGPAKTAAYFLPEKQADGTLEAAFRGRQLRGLTVTLPHKYTAHVMMEAAVEANEAFEAAPTDGFGEEQVGLTSAEEFAELTVWEHDRLPLPADDEFIAALSWIDVAASIHADCSEPMAP